MSVAVLRAELQGYIADMPEQNLRMLQPLLLGLSSLQIVIEPADEEESAMIDAAMLEYEKDPSTFKDWETVKKELGYP
ncbi:MAG: hypothetical protein FWE09_03245 [Treponema sp.]|nr:hypothetical protein [Treponema sp.]